jgi:hypothetical protein
MRMRPSDRVCHVVYGSCRDTLFKRETLLLQTSLLVHRLGSCRYPSPFWRAPGDYLGTDSCVAFPSVVDQTQVVMRSKQFKQQSINRFVDLLLDQLGLIN